MFTTHGGANEDDWTSLLRFCPSKCDRKHAAACGPPHPTTSTTPPLCVPVFFFGVCVCVLRAYIVVCLPCMHSPPPSVCVVVYVCARYRKTITIRILDREEYNKQSSFFVLLESPQWIRNGKEQTGVRANHKPRIPNQQANH